MDQTKEQAWKELTADLELYRFYIELVLKGAGFVLFATGAIVSYALTNADKHNVRLALWLPIVANGGIALISFMSIPFTTTLRRHHADICTRAGLAKAYELSPLTAILSLSAVVYLVVTIGMLALLFNWPP